MTRLPVTDKERANLTATLNIYQRLVADLQSVLEEGWPSSEELEDAPRLDDWQVTKMIRYNLSGMVENHPGLEGYIHTSPLYAISEEAQCFRTQSRWYRLGKRRDEDIVPTCELR